MKTVQDYGRKVTGDIQHYTEPTEQADPQLFLDALDAFLELPLANSVKFVCYTPYFNDGDACTFSVYFHGAKINSVDTDDLGDYDDGYINTWSLGYYLKEGRVSLPEDFDLDLYQSKIKVLENALEGGAHDFFLSASFGDPSEVIANKDGFEVEYYEHD